MGDELWCQDDGWSWGRPVDMLDEQGRLVGERWEDLMGELKGFKDRGGFEVSLPRKVLSQAI